MDRRGWARRLPDIFIYTVLLLLVGIAFNAATLGYAAAALLLGLFVAFGTVAYFISQESAHHDGLTVQDGERARKTMDDVFGAFPDPLLIVTSDGLIARANAAAQHTFGYTIAELVGQPYRMLLADTSREHDHADIGVPQGNSSNVIRQIRTKDGRVLPVSLTSSIIPAAEGRPPMVMIATRDVTELETMRAALETTNVRYTEAIGNSRIAVFEYDSRENRLYLDASDAEALGTLSTHVNTLEAFLQAVPLEDHQKLFRGLNLLSRGKETHMEEEVRVFLKRRGLRWYLIRGALRAGTDGRIVGIVMDVTARKAAEIELQSRDRILQPIVHFSEVLLRTADYEQSIPSLLRELGEAAGVSRVYIFTSRTDDAGVVFGTQRYEWVAPGIQPQLQNADLQDVPFREFGFGRWVDELSKGQAIYGPTSSLPDSERPLLESQDVRSMLVAPIFVGREWWGFIGFDDCLIPRTWPQPIVGAMQLAADIIGAAVLRNRVEMEVATSRDFFVSVMKNLGQGVTVVDRAGRLVYLNPTYARFLGKPVEELIGHDPVEFAHGTDSQVMEENWQLRQQGRTTTYTSNIRHVDGTITEVMITGVPRYVGGQLDGSYSVVTDVSDRRKLEQQRLDLALEREKVTLISDFVRDTSHDFRTPLAVIQTNAYLIRKHTDKPEIASRLDMITQQGDRINSLLDSLLLAMELETAEPTLLRLDLGRLVSNCVMSQRERAERANLRIDLDVASQALVIRGEEGYLLRAVTLLMDNAISFTPGGGSITVSVSTGESAARVTIRDTGIGISADDLPFIFERMFRVDRSRNTQSGGSGMGLSIVKRIIELHGGRVEVESVVGEGSAFTIVLPHVQLAVSTH